MRAVFPSLLLLAGLGALVARAQESTAQDTTLLTGPAEPSKDLCPTRHEYGGFHVERGQASGRNEARALQEARMAAFRQLEDLVCAGMEATPRCLAARRNIVPFGAGSYDARRRSACASVAIDDRRLNSIDEDLRTLDAALASLAAGVGSAVGDQPLVVLQPTWAETGCTAGEVGAHLHNGLQGHLVGVGLATDAADPRTVLLRLRLSTVADRVQVQAFTRPVGRATWTPLPQGQVSFARDLFRIPEGHGGRCAPDTDLGLVDGLKGGTDGLTVDLVAAGEGGIYCEGEQMTPSIRLSAPARVRVYTLHEGKDWLVWPWKPEADRVYGPEDPPRLPPFTAVLSADARDTRLVVVATPAAQVPSQPAQLPCVLAPSLNLKQLDPGAAADAASFAIVPAGERICRGRGTPQAPEPAGPRSEPACVLP